MRTTIELKPEHRAKLLELAARRGEKGFSSVVSEALEAYFGAERERESLRKRALRLRGVLKKKEAEELRREVARIRNFWR
jgi:hypothetical protein